MDEEQKARWEEMCFNDPCVNATQMLIEAGTDMETALKSCIYAMYQERKATSDYAYKTYGIKLGAEDCLTND